MPQGHVDYRSYAMIFVTWLSEQRDAFRVTRSRIVYQGKYGDKTFSTAPEPRVLAGISSNFASHLDHTTKAAMKLGNLGAERLHNAGMNSEHSHANVCNRIPLHKRIN